MIMAVVLQLLACSLSGIAIAVITLWILGIVFGLIFMHGASRRR